MGLAGYIASEIGPHLSQLNLTICDLDMPDKKDWSVSEEKYMKYFGDIQDKHGCHDSLLSHAREGIDVHYIHLSIDKATRGESESCRLYDQ